VSSQSSRGIREVKYSIIQHLRNLLIGDPSYLKKVFGAAIPITAVGQQKSLASTFNQIYDNGDLQGMISQPYTVSRDIVLPEKLQSKPCDELTLDKLAADAN